MPPVKYRPGGKKTVPPPAAAQASMAAWKAGVFRVVPSLTAPKACTLNTGSPPAMSVGFSAAEAIVPKAAALPRQTHSADQFAPA